LIVVDSSAAIDFFVRGPMGSWAEQQLLGSDDLHVPQLFDLEVAAALRRLVLRGVTPAAAADTAVADLAELPVARYPNLPLLTRIWELRHILTPYDAAYVALAEELDAPLVTTDLRLARTPGLLVDVIAP
jgi:predicted nucleic acid-binding protein